MELLDELWDDSVGGNEVCSSAMTAVQTELAPACARLNVPALRAFAYSSVGLMQTPDEPFSASHVAAQTVLATCSIAELLHAKYSHVAEVPESSVYLPLHPNLLRMVLLEVLDTISRSNSISELDVRLSLLGSGAEVQMEVVCNLAENQVDYVLSNALSTMLDATDVEFDWQVEETGSNNLLHKVSMQIPVEVVSEAQVQDPKNLLVSFGKVEEDLLAIKEFTSYESVSNGEEMQRIFEEVVSSSAVVAVIGTGLDVELGKALLLAGFCAVAESTKQALELGMRCGLIEDLDKNDSMADFVDDELLAEYLEYLRESLPKVLHAIQTRDLESLRLLTHKLKSNAPIFGFGRLGELAAMVEAECKQGKLGNLAEFVDLIQKTMKDLEK